MFLFSALELNLNLEALNSTAKSSTSERLLCTAAASTVKSQQKHTSFLALLQRGGDAFGIPTVKVNGSTS